MGLDDYRRASTMSRVAASASINCKDATVTESWDGTVVKKSRGLLDGSNMYRRLEVRLSDGQTRKVRVSRALWDSVEVGDSVSKADGQDPVKG
jgi:hypothetical protein